MAGTVSSGLVLSKLLSQVPFESHNVLTSHVVGMVSHIAMGSAWMEGMESLSRCGHPDALPQLGLGDTLPQFGCASASLKGESGWLGSEDAKALPSVRHTEGLVGLIW